MRKFHMTVQAGDESFLACWDMTAWATFERLNGGNAFDGFKVTASNVLDALWAAIDAAAAENDSPSPISRRRLGTLFASLEDMLRAVDIATQLVSAFMPAEAPAGKAESGQTENRSASPAATSTPLLTSESAMASSGA